MSAMRTRPATGTPSSIAPTDCNVPEVGNDGITSLRWSPNANSLVSSSWDGSVRCWEVQEQGGQILALPKAKGEFKYHSLRRFGRHGTNPLEFKHQYL